MLTSNEVSRANFTNRVSQEGYDIFEVNEFLRAVGSTLSRLESGYTTGGDGSRLLEPNDVRKIDFTATIFRDGYDITEVDALLDEVKESLETYVRGLLPPTFLLAGLPLLGRCTMTSPSPPRMRRLPHLPHPRMRLPHQMSPHPPACPAVKFSAN